jgi:hypothetical protein
MSFNKNCNNQSSIQADTVQANVSLITPLLTLPSTSDYLYSLTSNNVGYMLFGVPNNNNVVIYSSGVINAPYLLTLPIGVWFVTGQVEYHSIANVSYTQVITQLSNTFYNKTCTNSTIVYDDTIINQVSGIYTVVTKNFPVNLYSIITFSAGIPISKIQPSTTQSTSTTATTTGVTLNITSVNNSILIGMKISGGVIVTPPTVINIFGTTITMSDAQTINPSTVYTFTLTAGKSFLSATRIG